MRTKKKRRQCGVCHVCCDLLSVEALQKEAQQRCIHQANKGCKLFGQDRRPAMCSAFMCVWLEDGRGEFFHDLMRPDRSQIMVRSLPDEDAEGMIVYEVTPGAFLTDKGMIVLAFGEYVLETEPESRIELIFADGRVKTWRAGMEWKSLFQESDIPPAMRELFKASENTEAVEPAVVEDQPKEVEPTAVGDVPEEAEKTDIA